MGLASGDTDIGLNLNRSYTKMRDTLCLSYCWTQCLRVRYTMRQLILSCESIPVGCNFQTPYSVQFSES
jgi:hypothetical protein